MIKQDKQKVALSGKDFNIKPVLDTVAASVFHA